MLHECDEKDLRRLLVMDNVNDGETSTFEGLPMPHVTMQAAPKYLYGFTSVVCTGDWALLNIRL